MSIIKSKIILLFLININLIYSAELSIIPDNQAWVDGLIIADSNPKAQGVKRKRCVEENDEANKENINFKKPRITKLTDAIDNKTDGASLAELKKIISQDDFNINQTDDFQKTALYWASQENKIDVVNFLLAQKGIDINKADIDGFTPLMVSTQLENIDIVKILLSHAANINQTDKNGFTPLMRAILTKNYKLVELLLKNNADVTKKTVIKGKEILPQELAKNLKLEDISLLIIRYEDQWINGTKQFCKAMQESRFDDANKILDSGIDINRSLCWHRIQSPLGGAVFQFNLPLIEKLLKMGAYNEPWLESGDSDDTIINALLDKYNDFNGPVDQQQINQIIKKLIDLNFNLSYCSEQAIELFKQNKIYSDTLKYILFNDDCIKSLKDSDAETIKILADHGIYLSSLNS